ncbi:hypothetical protein [Luteolibacter sp. Populi]|uniref:hypothetical protein n=1 Tax=Luteolibacter sp. Populi TaxID=3230487 RepID=UPI0034666E15
MRSPLAFILAAACPCIAQAAVVNIDFSAGSAPITYAGQAAAADPAGSAAIWNAVGRDGSKDRVAQPALVDSLGVSTSITLSLGISGSHASVDGDLEHSGGYDALMSDYVYVNSGSSSLVTTSTGVISGLGAFDVYDLYFYGQGDKFAGNTFAGQNSLFTIGGTSRQTSWDGVQGGDGSLAEGTEYVKFTVSADADGRIEFLWSNVVAGVNTDADADGSASRYAGFNALQIVHNPSPIPEASSALLAGLGALGLLRRRR